MQGMMVPASLFTARAMRISDQAAVLQGISDITLMRNAAKAVVDVITRYYSPQSVLVLCGPGNNGGDGWIIARLLEEEGWPVQVALLGDNKKGLKGSAALAAQSYQGIQVPFMPIAIGYAPLIVDAVFGIGLTRPVTGRAAALFKCIKKRKREVVAVDIPSGIQSDTGKVLGIAPHCRYTVTFSGKKPGHLLYPGRNYCGEVIVADIGVPSVVVEKNAPTLFENSPSLWKKDFPLPREDDHKYKRGYVLVASGNKKTITAICDKAYAALRAGAGLVTVLCKKPMFSFFAQELLAVMCYPLTARWDKKTQEFVEDPRKNTLLFSKESSKTPVTQALLGKAKSGQKQSVLEGPWIRRWIALKEENPMVIGVKEKKRKRFSLEDTQKAARQLQGIMICVGKDTIIADAEGKTAISPTLQGNPYRTLLAGIAAGFLAQTRSPFIAACIACWIVAAMGKYNGPRLSWQKVMQKVMQETAGMRSMEQEQVLVSPKLRSSDGG